MVGRLLRKPKRRRRATSSGCGTVKMSTLLPRSTQARLGNFLGSFTASVRSFRMAIVRRLPFTASMASLGRQPRLGSSSRKLSSRSSNRNSLGLQVDDKGLSFLRVTGSVCRQRGDTLTRPETSSWARSVSSTWSEGVSCHGSPDSREIAASFSPSPPTPSFWASPRQRNNDKISVSHSCLSTSPACSIFCSRRSLWISWIHATLLTYGQWFVLRSVPGSLSDFSIREVNKKSPLLSLSPGLSFLWRLLLDTFVSKSRLLCLVNLEPITPERMVSGRCSELRDVLVQEVSGSTARRIFQEQRHVVSAHGSPRSLFLVFFAPLLADVIFSLAALKGFIFLVRRHFI
ncbi:hypothetical protein F7725_015635 [Dissostichus mawsoni]|uniref:Transmembrane protein n=1 Tax=Dissostichus mawsoni TaxID=36200 RepID=A0A7J5YLF8_DISMA|nr:hypothetical protein F7725_015635 [Dissostichus mawsoni]